MNSIVMAQRKNSNIIEEIFFGTLRKGDRFFADGHKLLAGEDCHYSGDPDYDGYLFYDDKGESWFYEEVDTEIEPYLLRVLSNGGTLRMGRNTDEIIIGDGEDRCTISRDLVFIKDPPSAGELITPDMIGNSRKVSFVQRKKKVNFYKFIIYIGDWTNDGHGGCDEYIIKSNMPVETAREAHFDIEEKTGINIEALCDGYGQDYIEDSVMTRLQEMGVDASSIKHEIHEDGIKYYYPTPDDMARIWITLLQKADPRLKLEICANDEIPALQSCGFDERGNHIGFVGYGLYC